MDNFGDMFSGLGEMIGGMFGGDEAAEGAMGIAEMLSPDTRRERQAVPIVYARYLCGGPRTLNINDR